MKSGHKTALINTAKLLNVEKDGFGMAALEVFRFQYANNELYRQFCDALRVKPADVTQITDIPFLPVSFFKTHTVLTEPATIETAALTFESSGTTAENNSKHYVYDKGVYDASLVNGFREYYGAPGGYAILALLPSYLERQNASLVYMAKVLMQESGHPSNGFYIDEWELLAKTIIELEASGTSTLLLGVTFALLDFAAMYPMAMKHTVVMETGGMKGRRKEMTRREVHDYLKQQWQLQHVHSEYGMTELLSQAYSAGEGIFRNTATMRVLVRDINDPLEVRETGTGVLNIIDLANVYSCSFIATDDIGRLNADGTFEVSGRLDHSALRGCSLMTA